MKQPTTRKRAKGGIHKALLLIPLGICVYLLWTDLFTTSRSEAKLEYLDGQVEVQQQDGVDGHITVKETRVSKEAEPQSDKQRKREEYLRHLPHTYMDIAIAGVPKGRIVFALFTDIAPLAAENFRQYCTGEKDTAPAGSEAGEFWLKDKTFDRIVYDFVDQIGLGENSIYGGYFKDDVEGLKVRHDRPGMLSMANRGPNKNSSHFFITLKSALHIDHCCVNFGEVTQGFDIVQEINALAKGKPDNTAGREVQAKVIYAGQCKTPECQS